MPYWSFLPAPLPPKIEEAALGRILATTAEASQALGRLTGLGAVLPNPDLLVQPYMRREAIASSRIENTHTSFAELVAYETVGQAGVTEDTREVSNYVLALGHGLRHVAFSGITLGLIRDIHRKLMSGTRGERLATPGEFRSVQNHIDGRTTRPAEARYVPPPPEQAQDAMEDLVAFAASSRRSTPALIDAAILHYQFEAIHPFLDGNGRVGRVLIPLYLAHRNQLDHPLLYLSPYFERDRSRYYDLLMAVSTHSAWIDWIEYFLRGVIDQANVGAQLALEILALGVDWHNRLYAAKATQNAHRLADYVLEAIGLNARSAQLYLNVSAQTAYNAVTALEKSGILLEITGRNRDQIYIADELQQILSRGL